MWQGHGCRVWQQKPRSVDASVPARHDNQCCAHHSCQARLNIKAAARSCIFETTPQRTFKGAVRVPSSCCRSRLPRVLGYVFLFRRITTAFTIARPDSWQLPGPGARLLGSSSRPVVAALRCWPGLYTAICYGSEKQVLSRGACCWTCTETSIHVKDVQISPPQQVYKCFRAHLNPGSFKLLQWSCSRDLFSRAPRPAELVQT